jgi:hypothetical protein
MCCGCRQLEAKARLEADGACAEQGGVLAEVRRVDVGGDSGWVEVDVVEEIEGVGADFNLGVVTEDAKIGQTERLGQRGVDVLVARPIEGVAAGAWRWRKRGVDSGEGASSRSWSNRAMAGFHSWVTNRGPNEC